VKFALLLAILVVLAGCGGAQSAGNDRTPRYDLAIMYWPTGRGGEARTATLTCDPDGGTHPDPVKACDALLRNEDALQRVPPDRACTEIYGGPQLATVSGLNVDASFSRQNGCEISRWDKLATVLELPG
jgi:hypothetical protein